MIVNYSTPFELHDDAYVLKAMRPGNVEDSGVHGPIMKPELTEDGNITTFKSTTLHCASHSTNSSLHNFPGLARKGSNAHPLPGILKARVKQEYNH